jgi:RNA polymerase subunit RPABC4/transcription elongation factor Spt4
MSKFNLDNNFDFNDNEEKNNKPDKKTKVCSKCGCENLITSKFCAECGNNQFYDSVEIYNDIKNSKYCIHCKSKVNVKTKFCPNCGKNEFVTSLDEIEKNKIDKLERDWKNKINALEDKLNKLNSEVEVSKVKNHRLLKEYNELDEHFKKEIATRNNLVKEILEEKEKINTASNDEHKKLLKDKERLIDEYIKEEKNLNLKINNLEKSIAEKNTELSNLKNEVKQLKENLGKYGSSNTLSQSSNSSNTSGTRPDKEHIYFGTFENEPIKWFIIEENRNYIRAISSECLDAINRALGNEEKYWCTNFYNKAFTATEKQKMLKVSDDYVNFLSHSELLKYMFYKDKRLCGYNALAKKLASLREGKISWWLKECEIVNGKGDTNNTVSAYSFHGVRPVICISKK